MKSPATIGPPLQTKTRKGGNYSDVLPLKATRRDGIANLKCFWGLGHQRPNFDSYIYIHYAAPPYSAHINAIYFLSFGNVCLSSVSVCNAWEAQCRIYEWWMRTLILFLSRQWTKVYEIFRRCRKPLVLSNALFRLSVSRFVQKIFAIKSRSRRKTEQMQTFLASNFCGRDSCDFSTAVC